MTDSFCINVKLLPSLKEHRWWSSVNLTVAFWKIQAESSFSFISSQKLWYLCFALTTKALCVHMPVPFRLEELITPAITESKVVKSCYISIMLSRCYSFWGTLSHFFEHVFMVKAVKMWIQLLLRVPVLRTSRHGQCILGAVPRGKQ